jgi:hypothetical protein
LTYKKAATLLTFVLFGSSTKSSLIIVVGHDAKEPRMLSAYWGRNMLPVNITCPIIRKKEMEHRMLEMRTTFFSQQKFTVHTEPPGIGEVLGLGLQVATSYLHSLRSTDPFANPKGVWSYLSSTQP